jgi:hypothetical protein
VWLAWTIVEGIIQSHHASLLGPAWVSAVFGSMSLPFKDQLLSATS